MHRSKAKNKYTKEDEDTCIAVVYSIRLMALMHFFYFDEIQAFKKHAWMSPSLLL